VLIVLPCGSALTVLSEAAASLKVRGLEINDHLMGPVANYLIANHICVMLKI
jgi:hypothetical protein